MRPFSIRCSAIICLKKHPTQSHRLFRDSLPDAKVGIIFHITKYSTILIIKFVFCGKNSLKYQALSLAQTFLTEFFAVLYRLHDGFTRVPVAELRIYHTLNR